MSPSRRQLLATIGGAFVLPAGGCVSGQQATDENATTTTEMSTEGGDDGSAEKSYPDYNWGILDNVDPVGTDTVTMQNSTFEPLLAAIEPGTEVTFTNEDSFGHTVTVPGLDIDKEVNGGQSTSVTFEETGTYDYVCTLHPPDMLGRIEVSAAPSNGMANETSTQTTTETPTQTTTETEDDDNGGGGYY